MMTDRRSPIVNHQSACLQQKSGLSPTDELRPIEYRLSPRKKSNGKELLSGRGAAALYERRVEVTDRPYRSDSSTSCSQSGRLSTSRGFEPSGALMMPSRCIMSSKRAARP